MLPEKLTSLLSYEESSSPEEQEISEENTFHHKWGKGTSIFGRPLMSVSESNAVIEEFIQGVEEIEHDIGRSLEKKEYISECGEDERILRVEIYDEDREFLQDVVEHDREHHGEFVGDRYIAKARYQTWSEDSPHESNDLFRNLGERDLPVREGSLRDKVWLQLQSPYSAPESSELRKFVKDFAAPETIEEYRRRFKSA